MVPKTLSWSQTTKSMTWARAPISSKMGATIIIKEKLPKAIHIERAYEYLRLLT